MAERTFLIQRYCADNWPHVRGLRPFIASGPSFFDWVASGSIEKMGRHVLLPRVRRLLAGLFPLFPMGGAHQGCYQRAAVSEVMLREGVLTALWSVDSRECLPEGLRWSESISQVDRELPGWTGAVKGAVPWSVASAVEELLSGMRSVSMARDYVSEDRLSLAPVKVP